jgi:1-phosphofructokinase
MIYTVTFNPSVDYVMHTDKLEYGIVNRSASEEIYFGGKGINVSLVLNELGVRSKALGFVAGFTGAAIENGIRKMGIDTDFIHLDGGFSRINIKIKSGEETELNAQGPYIDENAVNKLFMKLDALNDGDILVLAGSIPKSLPDDIYEKILGFLADRKIKAVVDAEKNLLKNTLKYKPFLIKPNNFELEQLFGEKMENDEEIVSAALKLQQMGALNVLVSMGERGAILVDENNEVHKALPICGTVKNSVGAGDSMIAGFLAGMENGDYEYALRLGNATGAATAFSSGLAKREDILHLM